MWAICSDLSIFNLKHHHDRHPQTYILDCWVLGLPKFVSSTKPHQTWFKFIIHIFNTLKFSFGISLASHISQSQNEISLSRDHRRYRQLDAIFIAFNAHSRSISPTLRDESAPYFQFVLHSSPPIYSRQFLCSHNSDK